MAVPGNCVFGENIAHSTFIVIFVVRVAVIVVQRDEQSFKSIMISSVNTQSIRRPGGTFASTKSSALSAACRRLRMPPNGEAPCELIPAMNERIR